MYKAAATPLLAYGLLFLSAFATEERVSATAVQRWNRTVYPSARFGHVAFPVALPSLPEKVLSSYRVATPRGPNSRLLMLHGGWPWDGTLPWNTSWLLDPVTLNWFPLEVRGTPPSHRHYHSVVSAEDGSFSVVYAGYQASVLSDVHLLVVMDDGRPQWFPITPGCSSEDGCTLPVGRAGHSAVLVPRGASQWDMVVFGGVDSESKPLGDVRVLSIQRGSLVDVPSSWQFTWRPAASTTGNLLTAGPSPRFHHAAAVWGQILFVFGGTQNWADPVKDARLYQMNLDTYTWKSDPAPNVAPGAADYERLATFPYFVEGVWGHTVSVISTPSTSQASLLFYGGQSRGATLFPNDLVLYDLEAKTWRILPKASTVNDAAVEVDTVVPQGRRSHSFVAMPIGESSDVPSLLLFGGKAASVLDDMNVLLPFYPHAAVQTDPESYALSSVMAKERFRWTSAYVAEITPAGSLQDPSTPRSSWNTIYDIQGWGFSHDRDSDYYNSVFLLELTDGNDPHSPAINANTGRIRDCLTAKNSFRSIRCVAIYRPRGYFMVEVVVSDTSSREIAVARKVSYQCLDETYQEVNTIPPSVAITPQKACLPKPIVSEIVPARGYAGVTIRVFGSGFSTVPDGNAIFVGGSPCASVFNVSSDGTSLSCTLGAHFGESVTNVSVLARHDISYLNAPESRHYAVSAWESTVSFDYVLVVNKAEFVLQSSNGETVLSLLGHGFSTTEQVDQWGNLVGNMVEIHTQDATFPCLITSSSDTKLQCTCNLPVFANGDEQLAIYLKTWSLSSSNVTAEQTFRGTYCGAGVYEITGEVFIGDSSLSCSGTVTPPLPTPSAPPLPPPLPTSPPPIPTPINPEFPGGDSANVSGSRIILYASIGGSVGLVAVISLIAALLVNVQRRKKRLMALSQSGDLPKHSPSKGDDEDLKGSKWSFGSKVTLTAEKKEVDAEEADRKKTEVNANDIVIEIVEEERKGEVPVEIPTADISDVNVDDEQDDEADDVPELNPPTVSLGIVKAASKFAVFTERTRRSLHGSFHVGEMSSK